MTKQNKVNSHAVISLTLGILSLFVPLLGLILGILGIIFSRKAVKQINFTYENGSGLATAGMVCSIVGVLMQLFIVLGYIAFFTVKS